MPTPRTSPGATRLLRWRKGFRSSSGVSGKVAPRFSSSRSVRRRERTPGPRTVRGMILSLMASAGEPTTLALPRPMSARSVVGLEASQVTDEPQLSLAADAGDAATTAPAVCRFAKSQSSPSKRVRNRGYSRPCGSRFACSVRRDTTRELRLQREQTGGGSGAHARWPRSVVGRLPAGAVGLAPPSQRTIPIGGQTIQATTKTTATASTTAAAIANHPAARRARPRRASRGLRGLGAGVL